MANRDYDDRGWDRGSRDAYGQDDRGYPRQSSQSDDRFQGRSWDDRGRGDWDDRSRGQGSQWTGGPGFTRGGMSQSGGSYPRQDWSDDRSRAGTFGQGHEQGYGRGYGSSYGPSHDDRGQDAWRGSGSGYGSRQSQADMGYGGFGDRRYGGSEPAGGWSQGRDFYGERPEDRSRYDEDRFGRSRGSMGGAYGEGRRDYSDYRTDRDRSLLGDIASALGFGSDRRRDDRAGGEDWRSGDRSGQSGQGAERGRGLGPKGYTRSDSRIEEDVNERLSHGSLDASNVEVKVKDGEVTLTGSIRSRQDKRRAEDLADDVSGVRHVQNNLRVQEWSSYGAGQQGSGQFGSTGSATNVTPGQPNGQSGSNPASGQSASARSEPNKF